MAPGTALARDIPGEDLLCSGGGIDRRSGVVSCVSPHRSIVFRVRDRRGREILLTAERWDHIVGRHPELAEILPELTHEMQEAYEVMPSADPDEEWHYLKKVGPTRWLKVVVVFESEWLGRIITAFPRRDRP